MLHNFLSLSFTSCGHSMLKIGHRALLWALVGHVIFCVVIMFTRALFLVFSYIHVGQCFK